MLAQETIVQPLRATESTTYNVLASNALADSAVLKHKKVSNNQILREEDHLYRLVYSIDRSIRNRFGIIKDTNTITISRDLRLYHVQNRGALFLLQYAEAFEPNEVNSITAPKTTDDLIKALEAIKVEWVEAGNWADSGDLPQGATASDIAFAFRRCTDSLKIAANYQGRSLSTERSQRAYQLILDKLLPAIWEMGVVLEMDVRDYHFPSTEQNVSPGHIFVSLQEMYDRLSKFMSDDIDYEGIELEGLTSIIDVQLDDCIDLIFILDAEFHRIQAMQDEPEERFNKELHQKNYETWLMDVKEVSVGHLFELVQFTLQTARSVISG